MEDIQQIQKEVYELEQFMESVNRQQLKFPLDKNSIDVVHVDVVVPTGNVIVPVGLVTFDTAVKVDINGKKYYIQSTEISQ